MICCWQGKAVGVNRRLMPGRGGRWFANPEYKKFKESLAAAFEAHRDVFMPPVQVYVRMILNPRMDADSILKPIFDALELAGVVENDKHIKAFDVVRESRGRDEPDRLVILVEPYQSDSWRSVEAPVEVGGYPDTISRN